MFITICTKRKQKETFGITEDGTRSFATSLLQIHLRNCSPFTFLHLIVCHPLIHHGIQLPLINPLLQKLPIHPILQLQLLVLPIYLLLWEPHPPLHVIHHICDGSPVPQVCITTLYSVNQLNSLAMILKKSTDVLKYLGVGQVGEWVPVQWLVTIKLSGCISWVYDPWPTMCNGS